MNIKKILYGYIFILLFMFFPIFIYYLGVLLDSAEIKSYVGLSMGTMPIGMSAVLFWFVMTILVKYWRKSVSK